MTYAEAGVSVDAGNAFVQRIKDAVRSTRRAGFLALMGEHLFAGIGTWRVDLVEERNRPARVRAAHQGGLDGLLAKAITGLNAMPPKGTCADCSDDELKGAIEKMSGLK